MSISVIIPNFNGKALLTQFLGGNLNEFKKSGVTEVIIVDDASADGSVSYLQHHHPSVKLIINQSNHGFGKSCNIGIMAAKNPIILLLNNDMKCLAFDPKLVSDDLERPDVFAISGQILRDIENEHGQVSQMNEALNMGFFKGGWFSSELNEQVLDHTNADKKTNILWACGGAMLMSKEKFIQLNGFDELFYPFYCEDLDLSYRAWKQGWQSIYSPQLIFHHAHQSTIGHYFSKAFIDRTHLRNQYIFMWKNITDPTWILSHLGTVLLKILTLQIRDIRAILTALIRLPGIFKYRWQKMPDQKSDREILAQWSHLVP